MPAKPNLDLAEGLLIDHGMAPLDARPALLEAQRRGLDVDKIVNAYCARSRYETHRVLRICDKIALLEFDLVVESIRNARPAPPWHDERELPRSRDEVLALAAERWPGAYVDAFDVADRADRPIWIILAWTHPDDEMALGMLVLPRLVDGESGIS